MTEDLGTRRRAPPLTGAASPQALFQAGELKWGTDEEKFITIFGTRSVAHLRRGEWCDSRACDGCVARPRTRGSRGGRAPAA